MIEEKLLSGMFSVALVSRYFARIILVFAVLILVVDSSSSEGVTDDEIGFISLAFWAAFIMIATSFFRQYLKGIAAEAARNQDPRFAWIKSNLVLGWG